MNVITWFPGMSLDALERQVIERALVHYQGNKTRTAQALGIAKRTLDAKLERIEEEKNAELQRQTKRIEREREFREKAERGLRMEPATEVAAQQPVPVQERPEIQKVLPQQNAPRAPQRRRG